MVIGIWAVLAGALSPVRAAAERTRPDKRDRYAATLRPQYDVLPSELLCAPHEHRMIMNCVQLVRQETGRINFPDHGQKSARKLLASVRLTASSPHASSSLQQFKVATVDLNYGKSHSSGGLSSPGSYPPRVDVTITKQKVILAERICSTVLVNSLTNMHKLFLGKHVRYGDARATQVPDSAEPS